VPRFLILGKTAATLARRASGKREKMRVKAKAGQCAIPEPAKPIEVLKVYVVPTTIAIKKYGLEP